jgi:hexosaminidase
VPLLPDATSPGPVYNVDLMNSCWRVPAVKLDGFDGIVIDGAWLMRNYGLAHDASKVVARASQTPAGELEVHVDACDGPLLTRLPLPADTRPGTRYRLASTWGGHTGTHELCIVATAPIRGSLPAIGRVSFKAVGH